MANSFFQGTINPTHTPVKEIKLAGYSPGITDPSIADSSNSGQSYVDQVKDSMTDSLPIIEEIKKKHLLQELDIQKGTY